MITGPGLVLGLLLIGAVVVYLLRRLEPVASLLAAALSGALALALVRFSLTAPARIMGRTVRLGQAVTWDTVSLQITPASRALLIFLLITGAATFVLAWRTYQGRTFYPFGLVLLAIWSVIAMLQPLTFAPAAIVLAAILAVFLIQAGRTGETQGAWRQLLFPALAVPLFILATWYIAQAPLNPDDTTPYRIASWLLIAGFVLLLQPAPLHVALPAVAGHAPFVVASFLWIGGQSVTLFLLQRFLVTYPWLGAAVDSARWLFWLGMFTAALGGILAAVQNRLGRLGGYAALYDYGILIVALGLRGTAGLPTTIWLLLTRTLTLLAFAVGAATLRHRMANDRLDGIAGAVSRLPVAVMALAVGGFGLAGMPLTAQFASRWALLQLVSEIDVRWTLLLLIGALGVMTGTVRAVRACFGDLQASPVERESSSLVILTFGLIALSVLLGLFPQLLTGTVASVILPLSVLEP